MQVDKFISHRGANTDFVENTIKSFKVARDYGFRWFEIDVQMSSDAELFLFHDSTPQRFTTCSQNVTKMSITDLKKLILIHPTFKVSGKIPTLREYLSWADKNNVFTNLEFKITNSCPDYKNRLISTALELINQYPKQRSRILLSSFSNSVMNILQQDDIYRKAKLFYTENWQEDFAYIDKELHKHFIKNNYLAIIINYSCLSKERITYLKQKFGKVFVYSVCNDDQVLKLLSWGADSIFVDKKEQMNIKL